MKNKCPICRFEGPFIEFNRRPAAKCPSCTSLERHRLLWLYLRNCTDLLLGEERALLDIAPKAIFRERLNELAPALRYLSVDLAPGRAMLEASAEELPLPSGAFDAALAYHVLEHVADDRAALAEILRVLKPGGWAILQSPIDKRLATTIEIGHLGAEARKKECGQADHLRRYGLDYEDRLVAAGFASRPDGYASTLRAKDRKRFSIFADETIYLAIKPA